ncbi:MAG TPA: class II glutamine amidotransferase [Gaiellales bacterium]|nr:class II glutamine amidotransferase [Gaiellales bacterium]
MEHLLYSTEHSLIVQSLHSQLGAEETNGDGFGVGWYGTQETPAVFRSIEPAWNDRNLRDISRHITSGVVFAHIRASTGSPVQQTNCHPFRHGRWLWMHNGLIHGFPDLKRDLLLEVAPALFPEIEGTTDSELLFYLALTFGLEADPWTAVARAVGLVEDVGNRRGVSSPMQGTIATTDGRRVWAFRYSSDGTARSLYYSTDVATLRGMYPDNPYLAEVSDASRLIVSEPLGDLPGAWNEVPEATCSLIDGTRDEIVPFKPIRSAEVMS